MRGLPGELNPSYKHGHATRAKESREYNSWCNMRRRCYDPKNNRYKRYGLLGITVCDRWNPLKGGSFENFLEDMGPCPSGSSLDRRDLSKNYDKENCRWANDIEQANNKSNSILIVNPEGDVWSLRRWCEILKLDYKSCWYYLFKRTKLLTLEEVLGKGYKFKNATGDNK